jgi:hypothetical protein
MVQDIKQWHLFSTICTTGSTAFSVGLIKTCECCFCSFEIHVLLLDVYIL